MRTALLFFLLSPALVTSGCDLFRRGTGDGERPAEDGDTDTDDDTDQAIATPYGGDCSPEPTSCAEGMTCAGDGVCRYPGEPGTLPAGEACVSTAFCGWGLTCDHTGTCATEGSEGTAGVGDTCASDADCQYLLSCDTAGMGTCYGYQPPLWLGETCSDPAAEVGEPRVFFEVPAKGGTNADFYRFPIPNDARIWDGIIDLTGHPTPGALIPELGDVAATVIDAIAADVEGWGTNQAVLFRFSHQVDYGTFTLGVPGTGTVAIVDITPSSPDYGKRHPGGWAYSSNRRQYICENWFALHPGTGFPMRPGNTYAAIITNDVRVDGSSQRIGQDAHFAVMMSSSQPTDSTLAHAWTAYQPLRDYLADQEISPSAIAGAAVFTTQDTEAPLAALRDAVHTASLPAESGLHLCDGTPGPYADPSDPDRGCGPNNSTFDEIQGEISLPQYQEGTPPFKVPGDGGAIGTPPTLARTEVVQFTLSIPSVGEMPSEGWPLVLYGHGTGGNYRSFARNGMAERLSGVTLDDGTEVPFAVLSIDAVQHGPRRMPDNWDATWLALDPGAYDPDVLFFNPLNPAAARDNVLQAAADYFALTRWVQTVDWDASASPTGSPIRFDPAELFYLGHSQGAQTGVGFVAHEPDVRAAVFSGGGGTLIETLMAKTEPVDLPTAMKVVLADPELLRQHPILNLAQMYAERADAVNHARNLLESPIADDPRTHVFQVYGVGDTLTPEVTQYAIARAARLDQVRNGNTPLYNVPETIEPITGNRWDDTTGVVSQYLPSTTTGNGHYVLFDEPQAMRQATHFLATAVRDGVPTVVAP